MRNSFCGTVCRKQRRYDELVYFRVLGAHQQRAPANGAGPRVVPRLTHQRENLPEQRPVHGVVLSAQELYIGALLGVDQARAAIQLQGVRAFGEDHYTGDYRAEYANFSGTEYLFGGTSTVGRDVQVTFSLDAESGGGTLFLISGDRRLEVLLDAQGEYERTLTLPSGSGYIGFTGKGLTGTLKMRLAPCTESEAG